MYAIINNYRIKMKLIAFDIEACNRYVPGSIFSIGVIESNYQFDVLNRYNILINPETKFVTKFRKPIDFNIDRSSLKCEKNFVALYPALKELFDSDALFLAHSITNDIRMLNLACKRYRLPSFKFKFICSQILYSIYSNTPDGIGLDSAAELISENFVHHLADEDALLSLKLVQYICKTQGVSLEELLNLYEVIFGSVSRFDIKPMQSQVLNTQRQKRKEESRENRRQKESADIDTL